MYNVLSAIVPLYVTMFLAYGSVKWWKVFTPDQCSGINRFVATFAVPLLSFEFISRINPFKMNFLFIAADSLSKVIVLIILFLLSKFTSRLSLDWAITLFSLATLPNTLVMGIPLIKSMYGDEQESLMIQVVVLQSIIWYTLLLFLFEYRGARDVIISRRIGEESPVGRRDDEEEDVVHVIVARPSTEIEQQKVQMSSRVAPELCETSVDKGGECGKELHMFVWRCGCCNSQGVCEKSMKVCSKEEEQKEVKESGVGFKSIMKMVWFKLVKNPNTYASLLGVSWALVSSKWGIKKPLILNNSVTLLSDAGLGMAMFSLGLFMALQPKIIACGKKQAIIGMLIRFVASPAVMSLASIAVGIKGTTLKVSLIQAALPQGIVPFVFAREYNLHPEVLSTAVIFGMIVAFPVTTLYYILLGL